MGFEAHHEEAAEHVGMFDGLLSEPRLCSLDEPQDEQQDHAPTKGPRRGSGSHARDIKKNARFQLLLVETMFHQIADTHNALQFLVLDHR